MGDWEPVIQWLVISLIAFFIGFIFWFLKSMYKEHKKQKLREQGKEVNEYDDVVAYFIDAGPDQLKKGIICKNCYNKAKDGELQKDDYIHRYETEDTRFFCDRCNKRLYK